MKIPQALLFLLGFITTIHALALPGTLGEVAEASKELFKRKGGGGGGGKGGGGGSSSSSSGSGGKGGSTSSGSSSSSSGSRTGSSASPSYGSGGRYYGGGSSAAYGSGARSPGGISPLYFGAAGLAFFPGIWLYGAYAYGYPHGTYHNNTNNQNETHPVQCLCAQYQQCGCDNNTDSSYLDSVANNATVAKRAVINGTDTLVINGTLPNGTEAVTASSAAAGGYRQRLAEMSGFWVVVAGVGYAVTLL